MLTADENGSREFESWINCETCFRTPDIFIDQQKWIRILCCDWSTGLWTGFDFDNMKMDWCEKLMQLYEQNRYLLSADVKYCIFITKNCWITADADQYV